MARLQNEEGQGWRRNKVLGVIVVLSSDEILPEADCSEFDSCCWTSTGLVVEGLVVVR